MYRILCLPFPLCVIISRSGLNWLGWKAKGAKSVMAWAIWNQWRPGSLNQKCSKSFIIIILVITFMQGIYNCIPETNHVSRVCSVAAVLYLQFMLHVMIFHTWNMYIYMSTWHKICAVSNMAVFCSPLISCFPVMLLRYCLSDFEIVPVALITTGINFAFTFHMCWISLIRSLYLISSQLLSWSHFCLKKLQHLLICMFLFYYHRYVWFIFRNSSINLHLLVP